MVFPALQLSPYSSHTLRQPIATSIPPLRAASLLVMRHLPPHQVAYPIVPPPILGDPELARAYILIPNLCYFDGARRWSFDADPKVFQSNFVCFTPQSCLLCALRILGVQPQVTTRLQNASRPKSEPLRSNFARF